MFRDSPYRVQVPVPGPCDAIVTPSTPPESIGPLLNDPSKSVFCFEPGDYRAAGMIHVWTSGSPAQRHYIRYHGPNDDRMAFQRTEQALFEAIHLMGSWWVVQGITFLPVRSTTDRLLAVRSGDHCVLEGNLVDGSEQVGADNNGIQVQGYQGDPATYNTIQANVVRNGNASRIDVDYEGIMIGEGWEPGESNDFNQVLDNEVYDWGDGVTVSGHRNDCAEPGVQHGTVIDGNDIYITSAKRIDCLTGAPDPDGECSCAENGIDVKAEPGPDPAHWTRITNNRLWGFRPTSGVVHCGGSGANGQAITAGNACPGHVLVARNLVMDATQGITVAGRSWIVAGNVLHDTRRSERMGAGGTMALLPASTGTEIVFQFNTVVDVDNAYDDMSAHTLARCNVVIDDATTAGAGGTRGIDHLTELNFLYQSRAGSIIGSSNASFPSSAESNNTELCFWRKRWTAPERVCIPLAATTSASPHRAGSAGCDPSITEPFGIGPVSYAPEPGGAAAAATAAATAAALAHARCRPQRRRAGASPSSSP